MAQRDFIFLSGYFAHRSFGFRVLLELILIIFLPFRSCNNLSPAATTFVALCIGVSWVKHLKYVDSYLEWTLRRTCRFLWQRGLRRRSAAALLLRLWFRIPPEAWMPVCCECCVVRQMPLRGADHSSRGVLPTVVRRCV